MVKRENLVDWKMQLNYVLVCLLRPRLDQTSIMCVDHGYIIHKAVKYEVW